MANRSSTRNSSSRRSNNRGSRSPYRSGDSQGGSSSEIIINAMSGETRVAILEQGLFSELHIERDSDRSVTGTVTLGKVTRVLPGMQAAFVDIGLERAAFLHVSDIAKPKSVNNENEDTSLPNIRELVHEGEEIPVQVVKNPLGKKGARLTTFITLSSRYLVLLTKGDNVGVATYIEDERAREHLRPRSARSFPPVRWARSA